jgi:hypothetical protein
VQLQVNAIRVLWSLKKAKNKKKNEIFLKELIIFYFGNKKRNTAKVAVEYYRV